MRLQQRQTGPTELVVALEPLLAAVDHDLTAEVQAADCWRSTLPAKSSYSSQEPNLCYVQSWRPSMI
jgi:uncharacterized protein YqcC (DUF446 family)